MTSETPLAGKTALVTGASRGIGRAVAIALAEAGAGVWAMARSADALAALARSHGTEPLVVDLTDDAEVWTAIDGMVDRIGAPDVVVNAAGVFALDPCASVSVVDFDAHVAVNLRGAFLVVRAVLPSMLERRTGVVVNIGSVAGRKALPGNAAYAASKYGLRGLHEVLVEELRGTGVRATLIEPAATDTELWDPLDPDSNPALPSRADMLRPEQVADAVLFAATRPDGVTVPLLQVEAG